MYVPNEEQLKLIRRATALGLTAGKRYEAAVLEAAVPIDKESAEELELLRQRASGSDPVSGVVDDCYSIGFGTGRMWSMPEEATV